MSGPLNLRADAARRRIRIVHLQLLPILSGVQRVSLDEFSSLDQRVFEPHLICQSRGPFPDAAAKLGVKCHFAHKLERNVNLRKDYAGYRQVLHLLRKIQPDIVHTHSSKTGLLGRFAARAARVQAVVHSVHGFAFPSTKNWWKRRIFQSCEFISGRMCDAIVCLNRSDEEIASGLLRVPREKVFRIPNGIRLHEFQPVKSPQRRSRLKRELLDLDDRPLIMKIGRLWDQKNPELFVRSAVELIRSGIQANFVLVGDGPLKERLSDIVEQSGVSDRLHLLGWRSDVAQILPLADMLVLSSSWEGMPLVILEANACAVPAVATDIPGSRDCIMDAKTGLLARADDRDDLSAKIKYLIDNPSVLNEMSRQCYDYVHAFHDLSTRNESVSKLYALILRRKGMENMEEMIHKSLGGSGVASHSTNRSPHLPSLEYNDRFGDLGQVPTGIPAEP